MNAKYIKINGERLDVFLRHYYSVRPLIEFASSSTISGGRTALDEWDRKRNDKANEFYVSIEIDA